jgi:hypothetical protein
VLPSHIAKVGSVVRPSSISCGLRDLAPTREDAATTPSPATAKGLGGAGRRRGGKGMAVAGRKDVASRRRRLRSDARVSPPNQPLHRARAAQGRRFSAVQGRCVQTRKAVVPSVGRKASEAAHLKAMGGAVATPEQRTSSVVPVPEKNGGASPLTDGEFRLPDSATRVSICRC